MRTSSKNIFVLFSAFISIVLLIVARHHPPSRRKIKEIWHGRVYWEGESNTTMLRSSPIRINEKQLDDGASRQENNENTVSQIPRTSTNKYAKKNTYLLGSEMKLSKGELPGDDWSCVERGDANTNSRMMQWLRNHVNEDRKRILFIGDSVTMQWPRSIVCALQGPLHISVGNIRRFKGMKFDDTLQDVYSRGVAPWYNDKLVPAPPWPKVPFAEDWYIEECNCTIGHLLTYRFLTDSDNNMKSLSYAAFEAVIKEYDVIIFGMGYHFKKTQSNQLKSVYNKISNIMENYIRNNPGRKTMFHETFPQHFKGESGLYENRGNNGCFDIDKDKFYKSGGNWRNSLLRKSTKLPIISTVSSSLNLAYLKKGNGDCTHWNPNPTITMPLWNTETTNIKTPPVDTAADITVDTSTKRDMQVMVSVLSRRTAFETRQVIRETWASGHNNVFFAVGVCCPIPPNDRKKWACKRAKSTSVEEQSKWDMECTKQDLKIAEEEVKYKDIIRMPDIDVYRHLPQKVKFSYKWGLEHTTAKWFVKTDDDSVVRIDTLGSYLKKTYNSDGYVVVGRVADGWGVPRSGKWAENNYRPSKYPKFPLGSVGHVVSKGVATYIVDNSDKLFNYQGEDVSIGIWLDESPLKSKVKWVTSKHMTNHGNCKDNSMWVMGHNIKPATMKACFAHKDEIKSVLEPQKIYAGVNLMAGLGNNLFMLASIQGIAHKNKAIPCYSGSSAAAKDLIEIDIKKCPSKSYKKQFQNGYAKYTPFEITTSTTIGTYLQSYKYFKSIPPFKIKQDLNSFAQKYIKKHSNKATNVGIHVRRGDHLKHGYLNFPDEQYFKNAMQYFTRKYGDVQFFVVSNEISWCEKQTFFKGTQIISEKHTAAQDMAILANCDHIIISLGTFGWWGGLLSGGEVVYYENEFKMDHKINKGKVVKQDYYPPEWKKMSAVPLEEKQKYKNTIVTAYFELSKSKHSTSKYDTWMGNMLSLQDAMVIFTSPDLVSKIESLRAHAMNRTKIISMKLSDTMMMSKYSMGFWKNQFTKDPEKYHSPELYIIWQEKTNFLKRAKDLNPFGSDFLAWVDIGFFRNKKYNNQVMIKRIPYDLRNNQVMLLDVTSLVAHLPKRITGDGKYLGGGFIGGYGDGIDNWYNTYYSYLDSKKTEFIGTDQPRYYQTCALNKGLCNIVQPKSGYGDKWFYMAPYLSGTIPKKKSKISSMVTKCQWSPLFIQNPRHIPDSAKATENYDLLSTFYKNIQTMGIKTEIALIGGQMRCLYMYGEFCSGEGDIDLSGGETKNHRPPTKLKTIITSKFKHAHITFDSTDYSRFGICECTLPNGRPFVCLRDIRKYLNHMFGSSWWVPLPGMKYSIKIGNERRPTWTKPVIKSLNKYIDKSGVITSDSISSVRIPNITDAELQASADEMNNLLLSLLGDKPDRSVITANTQTMDITQSCLKKLASNMPIDKNGEMKAHHWDARTGKWNEEKRWLPMNLVSPCIIWYVGANTHGRDGVRLQKDYSCDIHVFEPVPSFANVLEKNWKNVPRSTVHAFGLGSESKQVEGVHVVGESTFAMSGGKDSSGETVHIKSIVEAWEELGKPSIDLLHMNCEGCEWEMLETLISSDIIHKVRILQVGTHWFADVQNIEQRYCAIEAKLETTHEKIYQQYFGWERWQLKQKQNSKTRGARRRRVLHLSHHVGLLRDFEYVASALGFDFESMDMHKQYRVSSDFARQFWRKHRDFINSFDVVVTSDTPPLARIVLENLGEFKGRLVVWVCNRLDYQHTGDAVWYEMLRNALTHHQVQFVPYTEFEKVDARERIGLNMDNTTTITPIGRSLLHTRYEKNAKSDYTASPLTVPAYGQRGNGVFVTRHHNDQSVLKLHELFRKSNVPSFTSAYTHPQELATYTAVIHFPDALSKLLAFETLQYGVPVVLPSVQWLRKLRQTPGYFYNMDNVGGRIHNADDYDQLNEWYRCPTCRIYVDSTEELVETARQLLRGAYPLKQLQAAMRRQSASIQHTMLSRWSVVLGLADRESQVQRETMEACLLKYKAFLDQGTRFGLYEEGEHLRSNSVSFSNQFPNEPLPQSRYVSFLKAFRRLIQMDSKVVVEAGATRSFRNGYLEQQTSQYNALEPSSWDWGGGSFSRVAAECLAHVPGIEIHSVDTDPRAVAVTNHITSTFGVVTTHQMTSENFLKAYGGRPISLYYADIGDPIGAWQAHVDEARLLTTLIGNTLASNTILLIDDVRNMGPYQPSSVKSHGRPTTPYGKSRDSIPFLRSHGWAVVFEGYQWILQPQTRPPEALHSTTVVCRGSQCLFRNLCVDEHGQYVAFWGNQTKIPLPPLWFKTTIAMNSNDRERPMTIRTSEGFVPPNFTFADKDSVFTELHRYYSQNVGHTLGDDVFAIHRGLDAWNLTRFDVRIFTDDQTRSAPFRFITPHPLATRSTGPVCFPRFLAGWRGLGFVSISAAEMLKFDGDAPPAKDVRIGRRLRRFRDFARVTLGVPVVEHPQCILLVKKLTSVSEHPSTLTNWDHIESAIRRRSPCVKTVTWSGMPMKTQLSTLANTHTLVVLPGSDAMNAVFLPDDAVVIMPDRRYNGAWQGSNEFRNWLKHVEWLHVDAFRPSVADPDDSSYELPIDSLLSRINFKHDAKHASKT